MSEVFDKIQKYLNSVSDEDLKKRLDEIQQEYEETIQRPQISCKKRVCLNCDSWIESGMDAGTLCGICKRYAVFIEYDGVCGSFSIKQKD